MSERRPAVLLYGRHVADLEQTGSGQRVLHYRNDPGAPPLSLTMPLVGGSFARRIVEPFLEGLLPERESAREAMARDFDVSARNPFALLANMGLDCAGAVQFCTTDEVSDVLARKGELKALDRDDVEARLRALRTEPDAMSDAFAAEARHGDDEVSEMRACMLDPVVRSCETVRAERSRRTTT